MWLEQLIDNFIQFVIRLFYTFVRNEIEKDRKCTTIWSLRLQAMQVMLPLLNILIKGGVRLNETGASLENYFDINFWIFLSTVVFYLD